MASHAKISKTHLKSTSLRRLWIFCQNLRICHGSLAKISKNRLTSILNFLQKFENLPLASSQISQTLQNLTKNQFNSILHFCQNLRIENLLMVNLAKISKTHQKSTYFCFELFAKVLEFALSFKISPKIDVPQFSILCQNLKFFPPCENIQSTLPFWQIVNFVKCCLQKVKTIIFVIVSYWCFSAYLEDRKLKTFKKFCCVFAITHNMRKFSIFMQTRNKKQIG